MGNRWSPGCGCCGSDEPSPCCVCGFSKDTFSVASVEKPIYACTHLGYLRSQDQLSYFVDSYSVNFEYSGIPYELTVFRYLLEYSFTPVTRFGYESLVPPWMNLISSLSLRRLDLPPGGIPFAGFTTDFYFPSGFQPDPNRIDMEFFSRTTTMLDGSRVVPDSVIQSYLQAPEDDVYVSQRASIQCGTILPIPTCACALSDFDGPSSWGSLSHIAVTITGTLNCPGGCTPPDVTGTFIIPCTDSPGCTTYIATWDCGEFFDAPINATPAYRFVQIIFNTQPASQSLSRWQAQVTVTTGLSENNDFSSGLTQDCGDFPGGGSLTVFNSKFGSAQEISSWLTYLYDDLSNPGGCNQQSIKACAFGNLGAFSNLLSGTAGECDPFGLSFSAEAVST